MRAFVSPLIEALRANADLSATVPAHIPDRECADALGRAEHLGSRALLAISDDGPSFAAAAESSWSLVNAILGGLEIPGDLAEQMLVRRSIGKVRYEVAATSSAFLVTRFVEPIGEYVRFCTAAAEDLPGWTVTDSRWFGELGHKFPLWIKRDSGGLAADERGVES